MASPPRSVVLRLKAIQAWDRARLRAAVRRHPGLHVDPEASSNLAAAQFDLAEGAELHIAARVTTERRPMALRFLLGEGAHVEIGADTWLRTEVDRVVVFAGPGARIRVGAEGFLNGCHLSAKASITLGRHAWVGFGSRIIDGDQHDLDDTRPEQTEPIEIGDYAWVAGDVTVLKGVQIGAHSVIGARSLVNRSVPAHTLAFGTPAVPRGEIGDRSRTT
jgi:acetyltransferase-like isoleucine patch superfamily enzyme